MSRVAIVSNRLPPIDRAKASAGGLATGLGAALNELGGTWIGWDGRPDCAAGDRLRFHTAGAYKVAALPLSQAECDGYYLGFANRTIWPLFHGRTDLLRYDPQEFATYRAVNARFARAVVEAAADHDCVWVHDYHFFLLARELRRLGMTVPVGFFLHIPFPSPDVLEALPGHRALVEALAAYDLVGFQTENDRRNFAAYVGQRLGWRVDADGTVHTPDGRFSVGVFPIGIDTARFAELAAEAGDSRADGALRAAFAERLGMIGVDRLDYTKGLPQRLDAYERLLETAPELRRRIFLLQIAAPSREDIPEYAELKRALDIKSGRLNARFGELDWTPVRYINRAFGQQRLAALYRLSRVGLVTPLRDGMNLVAKEYVAAQDPADPGVLVLSTFAGAAERLSGALLVNPYDVDGLARAMRRALAMPHAERRARWAEMIAELRAHDVHRWRRDFLAALVSAGMARAVPARRQVPVLAFSRQGRGDGRAEARTDAARRAL
ncbi:trehalose-6-phosphate synthase [Aquibium sp. A9E412]|uniref:alpha,alpha-trehalose-phosphate synthase (UDP-forming) n=1 Tax=Aquibium sp. A9E412 TaxID=2976767 RepID=UPI0025B1DAE5|nr:trehalose-6-phosphate synthase [Aquibium sp. A9E412]MDN2565555.1 trehalose-6-phosphate synthase [Aquibium sp. A9E412]